ncbi:MAG: zinc dependent phospholipase C family protein [Candidatus Moranbacteria bacterium]|nr:zinc dependent phospholipase C family protein [Candidatus Moranbacteria bacterium]
MPKEATHISFADRVEKGLGSEIRNEIADNLQFFRLGSIAPDMFYYSKIGKIIEVSDYMHGKDGNLTNEIILDFLVSLKRDFSSEGFSFVSGFITHCCLDIALHPVVYYFSGNYYNEDPAEMLKARYLHRQLETALVSEKERKLILSDAIDLSSAVDFLKRSRFFDKFDIPDADIRNSLKRQFSMDKLFRNPAAYLVMRLLSGAGIIKGGDLLGLSFSNLSMDQRKLPEEIVYKDLVSGDAIKTSLKELFSIAESTASDRIKAAFDFAKGAIGMEECSGIIKGESLDMGREGVPIDDIRFASPIADK